MDGWFESLGKIPIGWSRGINYAISGIFHLENRRENHVKSTQHLRWKVHYVYFIVVKLNMIEASHSYRYVYIYICDESLWKAFFWKRHGPFWPTHIEVISTGNFYWELLLIKRWNLMGPTENLLIYPLVNVYIHNYGKSPFFIGKFTN